jgi:hypothetical protein
MTNYVYIHQETFYSYPSQYIFLNESKYLGQKDIEIHISDTRDNIHDVFDAINKYLINDLASIVTNYLYNIVNMSLSDFFNLSNIIFLPKIYILKASILQYMFHKDFNIIGITKCNNICTVTKAMYYTNKNQFRIDYREIKNYGSEYIGTYITL